MQKNKNNIKNANKTKNNRKNTKSKKYKNPIII